MANDPEKVNLLAVRAGEIGISDVVFENMRSTPARAKNEEQQALIASLTTSAEDKPEIADHPSFLKDVKNGLVDLAKRVWEVPAARGYIATQLVRVLVAVGLPAGLGTVVTLVIDGLAK